MINNVAIFSFPYEPHFQILNRRQQTHEPSPLISSTIDFSETEFIGFPKFLIKTTLHAFSWIKFNCGQIFAKKCHPYHHSEYVSSPFNISLISIYFFWKIWKNIGSPHYLVSQFKKTKIALCCESQLVIAMNPQIGKCFVVWNFELA